MKFLHLSDLHLGKRVNEFSMLDDQNCILKEILAVADREKPDGVFIAGDIYDKSVPSAEATALFDEFLVALSGRGIKTFVIYGNHDSAERTAFGSRLMTGSGVYSSPVWNGGVSPVILSDKNGETAIYMLPFLKPAHVKRYFEDAQTDGYTDALRTVIDSLDIDTSRRNILITHQFITGAERTESEEISVGGSENVDAGIFSVFDYVALGHIHRPQNFSGGRIRYCGSPLKYSFSEVKDEKSVTVVDLPEKGALSVRTVPLKPMRDMREIRGKYDDIMAKSFYDGTDYPQSYLRVTLTDEEDIPEAFAKLRTVYPFIMKLDYDNTRTRSNAAVTGAEDVERKSPFELFGEFFVLQNNKPMSAEQTEIVKTLIEKAWEGEE